MSKRTIWLLPVMILVTGALWAANDPFVGKWKLNPSKSELTDQMKVDAAGPNRYAFDLGSGDPEFIVVDGTDQPGLFGTTLSVAAEGPDTWKVVRKKDGHVLVTGIWKLSQDGNTLHDNFTANQANGSTFSLDYIYKRTAGTSGFAGTWESTTEKVNSAYEIQIQPYEEDGLSFINPAQNAKKNMKFDGKDYAVAGPNVVAGTASSGRRMNDRSVELTDKINSKVTDTQQLQLSPDGRMLTITIKPAGRNKPNILVFDRE
jgi:hypothetical protein